VKKSIFMAPYRYENNIIMDVGEVGCVGCTGLDRLRIGSSWRVMKLRTLLSGCFSRLIHWQGGRATN
jgi:hypothetical protein